MDKTLFPGLGDGREGAIAYGEATDDFDDIEQFLDFSDPVNEDLNAIMAQPEAPASQATLVASTSMRNRGRSQSAAAIRSRAGRERLKRRWTEMEGMVEKLTPENEALKDKNRVLIAENTSLNQALKSKGEELDNLKRDLKRLMDEDKKQDELVIKLSERLVGGSDFSLRDEEIQKLNNEIDLLRQEKGMDSLWSQLMNENANLKDELEKVKKKKRTLKVALGAVCEKIKTQNPSP